MIISSGTDQKKKKQQPMYMVDSGSIQLWQFVLQWCFNRVKMSNTFHGI